MRRPPLAVMLAAAVHAAALAAAPRVARAEDPPKPTLVHVDAADGVRLERNVGIVRPQWETVCTAPCDQRVANGARYRIAGDGIRASQPFTLTAPDGGEETLRVDSASKAGFVLGIVGAGVGGGAALIGLSLIMLDSVAVDGSDAPTGTNPEQRRAGFILMGVGAAVAVVGLVTLLMNRHTTVEQNAVTTAITRATTGFAF